MARMIGPYRFILKGNHAPEIWNILPQLDFRYNPAIKGIGFGWLRWSWQLVWGRPESARAEAMRRKAVQTEVAETLAICSKCGEDTHFRVSGPMAVTCGTCAERGLVG